MESFGKVAHGVYVLRYPVLDVNVGLVVGSETALVVDTLSTGEQATAALSAIRRITQLPLVAANTHAHFDHCFGNVVFARAGAVIWGHRQAAAALRDQPERLRADARHWASTEPELARGLSEVTIWPPDREIDGETVLDLGGRQVHLLPPGPGHSGGDLAVHVPDADVILAGDLIEESGPPQFEDAYPLAWPDAVAVLASRMGAKTRLVPGHGAVVGRDFVTHQHAQLARLAELIREGHSCGAPATAVASRVALPRAVAETAVARGYWEISAASASG